MARRLTITATLVVSSLALSLPAAHADHTEPSTPLSPTSGIAGTPNLQDPMGSWTFIRNFQANPGSDLEIFRRGSGRDLKVFASTGTLGQADEASVGQRVIRLRKANQPAISWMFDHGSANCPTANPAGTTGLQHDVQVTPQSNPQLLIDATDATGRCHDPGSGQAGGGLEFIDISQVGRGGAEPREIHLLRLFGFSHNHTVDARRPWIVYNSSSDFTGRPWIDVVDIRSCLDLGGNLASKRDQCRPRVYRIPFEPNWTRQRIDGELVPASEAACHDITARGGRIYCAGLNATVVFDVSDLTNSVGRPRGTPLDCEVVAGTDTDAMVTDCSLDGDLDGPSATGFELVGKFNHPGRDCSPLPGAQTNCNSNTEVASRDGLSVAHESDPLFGGRFVASTDERGGGVVPGGASCSPEEENTHGNGGISILRVGDDGRIKYAKQPDGTKAIWIGEVVVPAVTFCTVHVIEKVPGEQRLIVAYYSQGIKILDYWRDSNGRWLFRETASLVLPNAATWAAEDFLIKRKPNGDRVYFLVASDIARGIDVVKWRGQPNPHGSSPPAGL